MLDVKRLITYEHGWNSDKKTMDLIDEGVWHTRKYKYGKNSVHNKKIRKNDSTKQIKVDRKRNDCKDGWMYLHQYVFLVFIYKPFHNNTGW